jgi:hypothetical protein
MGDYLSGLNFPRTNWMQALSSNAFVGGPETGVSTARAMDIFRSVSAGTFHPGGSYVGGGNYSNGNLNSPYQALNNLRAMPNAGTQPLGTRAGPIASYSRGLAGQISSGTSDGMINPALWHLGGNGQGNPLSTGLSPTQGQMLESIEDPAARKRMMIQFALQNQAEVAQFVSNVMKLLHEMSMGIIRNITS